MCVCVCVCLAIRSLLIALPDVVATRIPVSNDMACMYKARSVLGQPLLSKNFMTVHGTPFCPKHGSPVVGESSTCRFQRLSTAAAARTDSRTFTFSDLPLSDIDLVKFEVKKSSGNWIYRVEPKVLVSLF